MCKENNFSWVIYSIIFIVLILISTLGLYYFGKMSICNIYYAITVWAAIITLILNIYTTQHKINQEKLNHAVLLVQNFDKDSLRCARNFSRKFKKDHDNNNLPNDELVEFIEGTLNETKNTEWKQKYDINDSAELKSSLIHLFNFFQSVYTEYSCGTADKEYLLHNLAYVYVDIYDRFKIWLEKHSTKSDKIQGIDLEKFDILAKKYIKKHSKNE